MPRILVHLLALMIAFPTVVALDPVGLQNDGGSGVDGSDLADLPTPMSEGEHHGVLTASGADGADWFIVTPAPEEKMSVKFGATSGSFFFRVLDGAGIQVHQGFSSGSTFRYVGALGVAYRIGFVLPQPSAGATYDVALQLALPRAQEDAGLAGDAEGDDRAAARFAPPGEFSGELDTAAGDSRDWFALVNPPDTWARVIVTPEAGQFVSVQAWSTVSYAVHWGETTGAPIEVVVRGPLRAFLVATDLGGDAVRYTVNFEILPPVPLAQDDAGLGGDAPVTGDLPVLALGTYEGRFEAWDGDFADSFRVDVAEDAHLRLHVDALRGGLAYSIINEDFSATYGGHADIVAATRGARDILLYQPDVGNLGVARYRITLDSVQAYEAAIRGVVVGAPDDRHVREIRIDVANLDVLPVPPNAEARLLVFHSFSGNPVVVGSAVLDLGSYGARQVVIPWDTTHWIGNFRLEVELTGVQDFQPENDRWEVEGRFDGATPWSFQGGFGTAALDP